MSFDDLNYTHEVQVNIVLHVRIQYFQYFNPTVKSAMPRMQTIFLEGQKAI